MIQLQAEGGTQSNAGKCYVLIPFVHYIADKLADKLVKTRLQLVQVFALPPDDLMRRLKGPEEG